MKLIASLFMMFIFSFFIGVGLSNAQAVNDTPIMAKYRKYYEANKNNFNLYYVMSMFLHECRDKCSNKDKKAIQEAAYRGDMLATALNIGVITLDDDYYGKTKAGADIGEPWALYMHIVSLYSKDIKEAERYALLAKEKNYILSYYNLRMIYHITKDDDKLCAIAKEDYSKNGVKAIAGDIISERVVRKSPMFTKCIKKTPDELIEMFGREGQLIKGFALIKEQKYDEAYKTFESVYKEGDSGMLSANAGYCLGMMNYYGKGIKRDKDKGKKLLKESFNNGIVYETTPGLKKYAFPERAELQMYPHTKDVCKNIK